MGRAPRWHGIHPTATSWGPRAIERRGPLGRSPPCLVLLWPVCSWGRGWLEHLGGLSILIGCDSEYYKLPGTSPPTDSPCDNRPNTQSFGKGYWHLVLAECWGVCR